MVKLRLFTQAPIIYHALSEPTALASFFFIQATFYLLVNVPRCFQRILRFG